MTYKKVKRTKGYVSLVDEDRPGIKEKAALAFGAQVDPSEFPRGAYVQIVRVHEAVNINGFVGNTLVLVFAEDGKPFGTWTYKDGEILPGDGTLAPRTGDRLTSSTGA